MNTLGKYHTLGIATGGFVELLSQFALLSHDVLQVCGIGIPVGYLLACHTALHSCLCHGHAHLGDETGVNRLGNEIVLAEGEVVHVVNLVHHIGNGFLCQGGNGTHGGKLHLLVDGGCGGVQCATEDIGETYYVVYLVGIVGTACGHEHIGTCLHGLLVGNLGFGVCQGEHYGHVCHGAYHLLREHTALAEAQEHVGTLDGLLQCLHIATGGGKLLLLGSKFLALVGDHTLAVEHEDVLLACTQCHIELGT